VVFEQGERGVVESESTEPQSTGAIEEVVREDPAPRYRIRPDDERASTRRLRRPVQGRDQHDGVGLGPPKATGISSRDGWADSSARRRASD
jgi:hypothetical protein